MLLIAPDFRCATGITPALVARHGRRFRYRLFPARDLRFRRRTFHRLVDEADLIHCHANLAHFPALAAEADRRTDVVRVATVHHLDVDDGYVLDAAVAHADRLHVPSDSVAEEIDRRAVDRPVTVLPYVLDPPRRGPRPARPTDDWAVGWCGNSTGPADRKRVGTLIAALALLADRRPVLCLQGFVDPSLPEAAAEAGVAVRLAEARAWDRRWDFYRAIDVYCSPSRVEGGPLPVFEAAAVGVPVVTTRVGMAARLLDEGGAWEGDSEDPDRLASALAAVADAAPDERADRLRRAAAVTRDFGATTGVPRYEAAYAEWLGIEPAPARPALQARVELARGRLEAVTRRGRSARIRIHRWRHGPDTSPYGA